MVLEGLGACGHAQGCQEGQLGGAEPLHNSGDDDGIDSIEWMFVGIWLKLSALSNVSALLMISFSTVVYVSFR